MFGLDIVLRIVFVLVLLAAAPFSAEIRDLIFAIIDPGAFRPRP